MENGDVLLISPASKAPRLALAMMVKNESKRIAVTLDTALTYVDSVVILDTGSDDDTIAIIEGLCEKAGKPLHIARTQFIDFEVTRNELLQFADEKADWLLLMDCNDELRGGSQLREFVERQKDPTETAFYLQQEWWSGKRLNYFNIRLLRTGAGWRYRGVVHEFLKCPDSAKAVSVKVPGVVLYQDRTLDDDKSSKRHHRDIGLLLGAYKKDRTDPRTVFYLAQSYECVSDHSAAYKHYAERVDLGGFEEERFAAMLRCGNLALTLEKPWDTAFMWFWKAWRHSHRAEPLVKLAEHYIKEDWESAYAFITLACRLDLPRGTLLFVDNNAYEYQRWHLLGWIAYYVGEYADGLRGCQKALEARPDSEVDRKNIKFHEDKLSLTSRKVTDPGIDRTTSQ